jgi:DNA-binding CsgD family transcriptional regulator
MPAPIRRDYPLRATEKVVYTAYGFEVLRLAVRGESTANMAEHMHLSQKTVLNYLSSVRQKLDADNDFSLLHLAARHGLVEIGVPGPS